MRGGTLQVRTVVERHPEVKKPTERSEKERIPFTQSNSGQKLRLERKEKSMRRDS